MGDTDPRVRARQRHAFAVEPTVLVVVQPPAPQRLARGSFSDLPITERTREPPLSILELFSVLVWCFTLAFTLTVAITTALD